MELMATSLDKLIKEIKEPFAEEQVDSVGKPWLGLGKLFPE